MVPDSKHSCTGSVLSSKDGIQEKRSQPADEGLGHEKQHIAGAQGWLKKLTRQLFPLGIPQLPSPLLAHPHNSYTVRVAMIFQKGTRC